MVGLASLRALVAVVDTGGFAAAATRLRISQSAVSHAVAVLERSCGRAVVSRSQGAQPTAFGAEVLIQARIALAAVDAVEVLARTRDDQPRGSITVAAPPSVVRGLLPGLLVRWREELPAVAVEVFEGDDEEVESWLRDGTASAAVLADPRPVPSGSLIIGRDRFAALLPSGHPLAGASTLALADLAHDPFLLSASGCEPRLRREFAQAGVPFAPTHRIRQLESLAAMVAAGVGVSVVPDLAAPTLSDDVALVALEPAAERTLVLTGPADRPWSDLVTALIETTRSTGACSTASATASTST